jgi:citrate lyase subunit beta/citryl-CoA lyase
MTAPVHPEESLIKGEKPFPIIPACEHIVGKEKFIAKSLQMQDELGPVFDITCDCEDGAETGEEKEHAEMIVDMLNSPANKLKMAGVRIHDHGHPHWKKDVDILVGGLAEVLAYITIPKTTSAAHAQEMIRYIQEVTASKSARRSIPVHIRILRLGAGCIATALFSTDSHRVWVFAVLIAFGASAVGWNGVFLAEVARRAPPGKAAQATGGTLAFIYLGIVFWLPVFGLIADKAGSHQTSYLS